MSIEQKTTSHKPPAGPYLIGLDLGTSGVKCVLIDRAGSELACAARSYAIETPRPGWAETAPEVWVRAALEVLDETVHESGVQPGQIAGLGLAGQMHSLVCLGEDLRPLRPAILWADTRSAGQAAVVERDLGRAELELLTGNPLAAGFLLPSWLWLHEHEPETARRAGWLMLPKDYLRLTLTGQIGSEPADASSTGLFDPAARTWSAALLDRLGIDPRLLPPLKESAEVAGGLLPEIAAQCGLPAGLPVVMGASDQAAQAVGRGVIAEGTFSCTIGTGGQLFAPLSGPRADPDLRLHLFCHAAPGLWHLEAATLTAGLSLDWLSGLTGAASFAALADGAANVPPGAEGLLFGPFLAGERTPYMDSSLRAAFIGLSLRHTRAHLARAVMEGVVLNLRQGLDLMRELGAAPGQVIASGGAARHPLWLQLQADIFNLPVAAPAAREAAALGAALLAGVGTGLYADLADACRQALAPLPAPILPNPERVAFYAGLYPRFQRVAEVARLVRGEG